MADKSPAAVETRSAVETPITNITTVSRESIPADDQKALETSGVTIASSESSKQRVRAAPLEQLRTNAKFLLNYFGESSTDIDAMPRDALVDIVCQLEPVWLLIQGKQKVTLALVK